MSQHPRVAIIILTWNKREYVLNLLGCIANLEYDNFDIIVVDNASTDDTVEALKSKYPDIEILVNAENLGGTGGFNTGMKHALRKGVYDYLWLLDNDVEVDSGALTELIKVLESTQDIAVAGSAMYDLTDRDKLLETGYYIELEKGKFHNNNEAMREESEKNRFFIVDSVSSCSLCASTEAVMNVGIWDENYFIYCDDVDWNIRFRQKGYKIASVPSSRIWHVPWLHKIGFSTAYYANRNIMYLMRKHLPGVKKIYGLLYRESAIILLSAHLLKNKDYFHSIVVLKSQIDFLEGKFGKFSDNQYLDYLNRIAEQNPYRVWFKTLGILILKNFTHAISISASLLRAGVIEAARKVFKRLPDEKRMSLIKTLNNHCLSKKYNAPKA